MSSEIRFASCLGPALAQYLDLKLSVGLRFDTACRVLLHLDRFLVANAKEAEGFDTSC